METLDDDQGLEAYEVLADGRSFVRRLGAVVR
jgi:hypothetical protein